MYKQQFQIPSEKLKRAGRVLRTVLLTRAPHMVRDRKYHLRTYRKCMVGTEMVEWLLQQSPIVHSRNQAVGIWQALCEEGIIVHGNNRGYSYLENGKLISGPQLKNEVKNKKYFDDMQNIMIKRVVQFPCMVITRCMLMLLLKLFINK